MAGTLYVVATPLGNLGDLSPRAADTLKRLLELQPDDADSWYQLGKIQYELGNYDDAVEACRRSLELKPDLGGALERLSARL